MDVYNSVSGTWTTAQLSVGRSDFGAASVGVVAIFAGGYTSCAMWIRDATLEQGLRVFMLDVFVLNALGLVL